MKRSALWLCSLALVLSGCYAAPPPAISTIKDMVSTNAGHMADESLPEEARLVAQDNHDALHQLRYLLDGTQVPEDVDSRSKARQGGGE